MPRVEELPDNFNASINLDKRSSTPKPTLTSNTSSSIVTQAAPFPIAKTTQALNGTIPELPPQMASVRSHTADEIVQMMNRTPLFMTSLEDVEGEDGPNVELEAIRALQYEGTPAEVAQGFKEQGNEMTRAKRWKDGKEFYSKGIAALAQGKYSNAAPHAQADERSEPSGDDEKRKEKELEEVCYVNRALCNLELKNYRSTTHDCASALRLNPQNIKAYYRSSTALLSLDKLPEAADACTRSLTIDPTNTALQTLHRKIQARDKALSETHREQQRKAERVRKEKTMLATAFRARNIRLRKTAQPPDMEDAIIHLAPDPLSPTSTLHFPVILLYHLHAQSDFIKAFPETDTIPQHLGYIFPLPWDEAQEYTVGNVEFYMETGTGGLVKVGKNVTLGKVLGGGGVEVVDGLVRINVLLKGRTKGWIEEMKARTKG